MNETSSIVYLRFSISYQSCSQLLLVVTVYPHEKLTDKIKILFLHYHCIAGYLEPNEFSSIAPHYASLISSAALRVTPSDSDHIKVG